MISQNSRYTGCVLYRDSDGDSFGFRQRIDISPRPDDRFHTVVDGDRLDLLAYHYLGDANLWWVICDYNEIFLPLELEVGLVLRFPSTERVQMWLLELK